MLLLGVCAIPKQSLYAVTLSRSQSFLHAVQGHLSTTRLAIRYLGMLAAEVLSQRSLDPAEGVKPLDFGTDLWAGDSDGKSFCRRLRALLESNFAAGVSLPPTPPISKPDVSMSASTTVSAPALRSISRSVPLSKREEKSEAKVEPSSKPKPAKIQVIGTTLESGMEEDDDDLIPYAMPDADSGDSDVDLNDLATFTPGKKKARPPVYLADLATYLRANEDAEKVELGLQHAVALIRKKANWGTELRKSCTYSNGW